MSLTQRIEDTELHKTFARIGAGLNLGTWSRLGMYITPDDMSKVIEYIYGMYLPFAKSDAKPMEFDAEPMEFGVSTTQDPRILIDDGASFCTQIVAFDKKEGAVSTHGPLIGLNRDYVVEKYLDGFREKVYETLGDERVIAITSTNLPHSYTENYSLKNIEQMGTEREQFFRFLQDFFAGENVQFVVANQSPNDLKYTPLPKETCKFSGVPFISGYCYIPKQLSNSRRNEYFILYNDDVIQKMKEHGNVLPEAKSI